MRKRLIPLIALLMILAVVAVAYSVEISLPGGEPPDLGATPYVDVACPTPKNGACQIDAIKWKISTNAPRMVTGVKIDWNPGSASGYDVFVELYNSDGDYVGGGSATNTNTDPLEVSFSEPVDPRYIGKIRIVIIETGGYET